MHAFCRFHTTVPNPLHDSKLEAPIIKKGYFLLPPLDRIAMYVFFPSPSTPPKQSVTIEYSTSHLPFF